MSRDEEPLNEPNGLMQFWNRLDKNVKLVVVGAIVLLVLYNIMSPLQQCKRDRGSGSHAWCYANTSW